MHSFRRASFAVAMAAASVEGACAMTDAPAPISCQVSGASMLDPSWGSEDALCTTIQRRLAGIAGVQSVALTIQSSSRASAVMTLTDGDQLSPVHVASSDGTLKPRSFAMLADGLLAQLNNRTGK